MNAAFHRSVLVAAAVGLAAHAALAAGPGIVVTAMPAPADYSFLDDFEDGNHDGWLVTATGGGTNGVEFFNQSNWAFIDNGQSGVRTLSQSFAYEPDLWLSFRLHAVANTGVANNGSATHSAGGVTVRFENSFNVALGSVSFVNATTPSLLPSNSTGVSNLPLGFNAPLSEWADQALVNPGANISHFVLAFWSQGTTAQVPFGSPAVAHVRFDDVAISPIPEPASAALFLLGAMGLLVRRRLSSARADGAQ